MKPATEESDENGTVIRGTIRTVTVHFLSASSNHFVLAVRDNCAYLCPKRELFGGFSAWFQTLHHARCAGQISVRSNFPFQPQDGCVVLINWQEWTAYLSHFSQLFFSSIIHRPPTDLVCIDHIVGNQGDKEMDAVVQWQAPNIITSIFIASFFRLLSSTSKPDFFKKKSRGKNEVAFAGMKRCCSSIASGPWTTLSYTRSSAL